MAEAGAADENPDVHTFFLFGCFLDLCPKRRDRLRQRLLDKQAAPTPVPRAPAPPPAPIAPREPRGGPAQTLVGATVGFFVGFAAVSLFTPAAGRLRDELGFSPAQVSWLVAAPGLCGSLLRIPFAAWVDTSGGRKPFLVLLTLSMLGIVGLLVLLIPQEMSTLEASKGTAWLYRVLLFLGVLAGCGIAAFSVGISQVAYWHPQEEQGRVLGFFAGIGNLGAGLVSLILPLALDTIGLWGSYFIWLGLLIFGTGSYYLMGQDALYFQLCRLRPSPAEAKADAERSGQTLFPRETTARGSLMLAARNPRTWALSFIYFATFGMLVALTSWLPLYWTGVHGLSATVAGVLTALYSMGASLIQIPGGIISDRIGGELTIICGLVAMAFGAMLMDLQLGFFGAFLGEVVMAFGMGFSNAAVFKLVPQEVPEAIGAASGWVGGIGAFFGFLLPPAMVALVQHDGLPGYCAGFTIFVDMAVFALAAVAMLMLAKAKPHNG